MAPKAGGDAGKVNSAVYKDKSKPADIRLSNINAAKGYNFRIFFNNSLFLCVTSRKFYYISLCLRI